MKPEDFGITNYKFIPDGTLDVFQDVNLSRKNLTKLPFKFGKIDGYFLCYFNKLTSLKGAPEIVMGNFDCSYNKLKSIKYAPKVVNGNFNLTWNKLKSLEGLNLNGITGKIRLKFSPNLKLTEKEELWVNLNPGKLVLK